MNIEISTSPKISQLIQDLFKDEILKPGKMKLLKIDIISDTSHVVTIKCQSDGTPRDLFYLGYWTGNLEKIQ